MKLKRVAPFASTVSLLVSFLAASPAALYAIGTTSPARGKVFAKTGTFLDKSTIKAQVLAGYIGAQSGRRLTYALFVNDAGQIAGISDVLDVIEDEAQISTIIQQSN